MTGDKPTPDIRDIRKALWAKDADALAEAIAGCDIDGALQQIANGARFLVAAARSEDADHDGGAAGVGGSGGALASMLVDHLRARGFAGDAPVADAIESLLRGEAVAGKDIAVDVESLAEVIAGISDESMGGCLDLQTGDVLPDILNDPDRVEPEDVIDIDVEPDRWLSFERVYSRDAWEDMRVFIENLADDDLRERGLAEIGGSGAFRRFRRFTDRNDLGFDWVVFSDDRRWGRAREFLADNGIRVI